MKNTLKKVLAGLSATLLLMGSTACSRASSAASTTDNGKLQVYTSFYGMYDFTTKIAGEYADVYNLVPPGTEPHDWEPSTGDMIKLESADVLIYNGAGFEGWVSSVEKSLSYSNLTFVEASKGISLLSGTHDHDHGDDDEHMEEEGHDHEESEEHDESEEASVTSSTTVDPHVWLNPENVKIEMTNIADALKKLDPENSSHYEKNLNEQLTKLTALTASMEETAISFQKHDIIVAHEAYGYLCHLLNINQYGIEGLSADSDPTPARMAELATVAKEKDVRFIFFETLVSSKTANALAKEVGIEARQLDPFEGPGSEVEAATYDYYSVMEKNMATLREALN